MIKNPRNRALSELPMRGGHRPGTMRGGVPRCRAFPAREPCRRTNLPAFRTNVDSGAEPQLRSRPDLNGSGARNWFLAVPAGRRRAHSSAVRLTGGGLKLRLPGPARPGEDSPGIGHQVADDHGSCKGPPPDCRWIVIRLQSGIKGGCDRRTTSTGKTAWSAYTRSRP